jgi:adenylate cyclase
MPHDIFISYSSTDRERATELAVNLRSSGYSVWMDMMGIDVATKWTREIADALESCKALLLLLSSASQASENVQKEIALAAEWNKRIIPVELEAVQITKDLAYHLAGLQRTHVDNIEAIIKALDNLGVAPAPTGIKLETKSKPLDSKKSLMILPFEDLSPTRDNDWFADGLMSELIGSLSNIKSLRILDENTSRSFKNVKVKTTSIAQEYNIRYFIEGSVRKFGDQIKISLQLLDIKTGDHLWQFSHKGPFADIFEVQETVAEKVVEGLSLHLSGEEKKKIEDRGTENADAYELWMKAVEYFNRHTKDGYELAIRLLSETIRIDHKFADAYRLKSNSLASLYRDYDRNPQKLIEAESLAREALAYKPDLWSAYNPLSNIYRLEGNLKEAEDAAIEYVRKEPENWFSHANLGFFYMESGQPGKAISPYEEAAKLKPDYLLTMWNLVLVCDQAGNKEKCMKWANEATLQYERYLRLHPDNEGMSVLYANLLFLAGRGEEARVAAREIENVKDGNSLYNVACLQADLGDLDASIGTLRRAVDAGFRNAESFQRDHDLDPLRGMKEFEKMVEELGVAY